ncbi:MAG: hypothetical protein IJH07_09035 [Ruminococcus sp.]|nr:hypothetical protein [Ruminococcus sp.]
MAESGNIRIQLVNENALEVLLYKECVYQRNEYLRLKKALGEFNAVTNATYVRFQCCFDLIVRSGLENDYYLWQKKEGVEI